MRRWIAVAVIALFLTPCLCQGQGVIPLPRITVGVGAADTGNPGQLSTAIQILFLITALSLAPAFLIMMTSFTRIIVVLSFLRHGLATQQLPSNQILAGLALFLTVFVMMPIWRDINEDALKPYLDGKRSITPSSLSGSSCSNRRGRRTLL